MERSWAIRAYRDGDEEAMLELENSVLGKTTDRDQWLRRWRWKFQHNPAGAPVILLAEADGKLVGQYPIIRVKMKVGDEAIMGSQMVELLTHPDFQRQGVSAALAEQALSDARSQGLAITYGFPNRLALPSHLKAGYTDIGAQKAWIKPFNLESILSRYIGNKPLLKTCAASANLIIKALYRTGKAPEASGLTITGVPSFDERINKLWEKASSDHPISVVRDRDYLNWRYANVPGVKYAIYLAEREREIVGCMVLRCERRQGLTYGRIFELIVPGGQETAACQLIRKALEFCEEEKAAYVIYRIIGNRAYDKPLRENGFIYSRSVSKKARFIARTNSLGIPEALVKSPGNWIVQTGDSDAI